MAGTALIAVGLYGLLMAGGWLWLVLRERTVIVPAAAGGTIGLWASLAVGAALGLSVSVALAAAVRHVSAFARMERNVAAMLGPLGDTDIWLLALCSGLGEEFFFRLAMQDAVGLWPTAAVFAVLHIGPKGSLLLCVVAFALGAVFGVLVSAGVGLLAVTVAHAVINYLSLHRMQS